MSISAERQHAHELIERFNSSMLVTAARSLAIVPVDNEPLTQEEEQAIRRSEAWFEKNGGREIPMEDVLADFGLSTKFPQDH